MGQAYRVVVDKTTSSRTTSRSNDNDDGGK